MTAARGRGFFWAAAIVGLVHAGFSVYWALGGRWLIETVGEWAVAFAASDAVRAALVLGAVALAKALAAIVPLLVDMGRIPGRRFWRLVSWIGGLFLILYGALYSGVAIGVLSGVIASPGGYDRASMIGHAYLWDPLFVLWGALLVTALILTRPRKKTSA